MNTHAAILVNKLSRENRSYNTLSHEYAKATNGGRLHFIDTDRGQSFECTDGQKVWGEIGGLGELAAVHFNGIFVKRSGPLGELLEGVPAINYGIVTGKRAVIEYAMNTVPINKITEGDKIKVFVANGGVVNAINANQRRWLTNIPALVGAQALLAMRCVSRHMSTDPVRIALQVDIVGQGQSTSIWRAHLSPQRVAPNGESAFDEQAAAMPRAEIAALVAISR